jgi:Na+/H+ antiporter NhaD/arsenite permease-like protein
VAGLEHSGVIARISGALAGWAGQSLPKATLLMTWVSGLLSGVVDNIPITIAMLPVAGHLSQAIPAAQGNPVLSWALIFGADFGGNLTYIGGAANIVAVGLLAQAGYRVGFGRFLRDGAVVTVASLLVVTLWLLVLW